MTFDWTTAYGAISLGKLPFSAVEKDFVPLGPPSNIEHIQYPFRQWDGDLKKSASRNYGKAGGQVFPLDEGNPSSSCNEVEVAKLLRRVKDHAFWVNGYNYPMIERWEPWVISTDNLPPWLATLDAMIRPQMQLVKGKLPKGGIPDVVAWNDDDPLRSSYFVECKGMTSRNCMEEFKTNQDDWVWLAQHNDNGISENQIWVSVRPYFSKSKKL